MKRSLIIVCALFLTAASVMAAIGRPPGAQLLTTINPWGEAVQPTVFAVDYAANSFGVWPPSGGWTLNPASGTGAWAQGSLLKGPGFSPTSGAEGTRHFAEFNSFDWAVGTVGNLISPAVILPSPAEDCSLTFYFWNHSYNVPNYNYDTVTVSITTDGGSNWTVITKQYGNVDDWTYRTFPLGAYAGQTIQIRFRGWSDYGASDPSIDEVKIGRKPADNVGVHDIVSPGPSMPAATSPVAIVRNYGTSPATFDAVCVIDSSGTVVYTNTKNVSGLAPGAQQTVTFDPYTPVPLNGDVYKASVYTTLAGDGDPSNDTLKTIFNSNPFQRKILGMDFTATWCQWCPWHQVAWHRLKEEVGDSLCMLGVHSSSSGDSFYNANSGALKTYYSNGTGYPTSLMDGIYSWVGSDTAGAGEAQYQAFRYVFDQRKLNNVQFVINLDGVANGSACTLHVATNYPGTTPVPITMRVGIIEYSKHSVWPIGYPMLQDSVFDVVRAVIPQAAGDTFSVVNGTIVRSYPFNLNPGWNTSNLGLIAWAEKRGLKENIQSAEIRFTDFTTGVSGTPNDPGALITRILSCAPNPAAGRSVMSYQLAAPGHVNLGVYDVAGRLVRTLENGVREAGRHAVVWDGRDNAGKNAANGIYFYRLAAGGHTGTRKLIIVR